MTDLLYLTEAVSPHALPALIASAGERASWRFLDFFTVKIRNKNTRAGYSVAAREFLRWCEQKNLTELAQVKPMHVAAYIEQLQGKMKAPSVKQHEALRAASIALIVAKRRAPDFRLLRRCALAGSVRLLQSLPNSPDCYIAEVELVRVARFKSFEAEDLLGDREENFVLSRYRHTTSITQFNAERKNSLAIMNCQTEIAHEQRLWSGV
jgi:hypothetical protein